LKLGWWGVFEQLEHGQIIEKEHELFDEKFDMKCCHKYLISPGWCFLVVNYRKSIPNAWGTIEVKVLVSVIG